MNSAEPAVKHTPADHIERLQAMAMDHGETWDLSPNDRAAILYALSQIQHVIAPMPSDSVREILEALEQVVEWERDYRTRNNLGVTPPHPFKQAAAVLRKNQGDWVVELDRPIVPDWKER